MEKPDASPFGEILRRYRVAAALTQEELAERAGVSARAVSDLERGVKRRPHRDTLRLLAAALGLDATERATFEAARGRGPAVADRASGSAAAPDRPAAMGLPLVGRAPELALLERHLAGTGPPVLVLAGEPGIGKSRLLQEAAARAPQCGWRVLAGGCQRRSGQAPFAPVLDALDAYLGRCSGAALRTDLRGCAWLVRLLPELAAGPIEPLPPWTLSPEQERRLMDKAVGRFLANVAGSAGTLLLLDDLQWAGPDALDLLATLVRAMPTPAVRVIGTYRDTEVPPSEALSTLLADLAQAGLAQQRSLTHLTPSEAACLLDSLRDATEGEDAETRVRLLQRAGGVPFYLVSFAQGVRPGAREHGIAEAVPWDVAQGIRQRVATLAEGGRAVMGAAAVLGRMVHPDLLVAVVEQSPREVFAALDAASRARLLLDEGQTYRFAHDLIREVIEGDVGAARRMALHRRTAEALEREPGQWTAELLAFHFSRGHVPEKAAVYLEQAGDHAWVQHATAAAADFYRDLVGCLEQLGRPLDAARSQEKLGAALRTLARYKEALAVLDQAAEAYRLADDMESLGRTMAQIGRVFGLLGLPSAGIDRLQPVVAALEAHTPSPALAALYAELAQLFHFMGQYDQELAAGERAGALARTLQDERTVAFARYQEGMALVFLGRTEDGLRLLDEAIAVAEAADDLSTVCEILDPVGYTNILRGEFATSTACYERAATVAERLGDPLWIATMISHRGAPALYMGHWDQARADFEQGVMLGRQVGTAQVLMYTLDWRGWLHVWAGEWVAARRDLEEACALAEQANNLNPLRHAQTALAELDVLEARPEAARARLAALLDRPGLEEMDVTFLLPALAWAHVALGDVPAAAAVASQAIWRARAQTLQVAMVDALRVQGMIAIQQTKWEDAIVALEEGLHLARAMPYPYAEGRLLHVSGEMQLRRAEPDLAVERLEAALAIFRRLGARQDAERVAQALGDLSLRA